MSAVAEPARAAAPTSRWQSLAVRLAVVLAFADASIVVLALPQIVGQLDTSISKVTWVITAYNVALVASVLAILPFARRVGTERALALGLAIFGLASLGCGVVDSLRLLVLLRCVQGAGAALLLCASVPLLAGSRPGGSSVARWASAAALGAAIGPAVGGLLTQVFDWRAIFLAQAPVAALALVVARRGAAPAADADEAPRAGRLGPGLANLALATFSAGLIGALFLVVVLLIDVWRLAPLGAALVVSAIPLATVLVERAVGERSSANAGIAGAILLAVGLAGIALVPERNVVWVVVALALCGAGLGLAVPTLTTAALSGRGSSSVLGAKTVAARHAGLVVGLLILTPILVRDLNRAPGQALPAAAGEIAGSPVPGPVKARLVPELLGAVGRTPQGQLPKFGPAFATVKAGTSGSTPARLDALQGRLENIVERAVTRSFRRSLLLCALFALLALPVLALSRRGGGRDGADVGAARAGPA